MQQPRFFLLVVRGRKSMINPRLETSLAAVQARQRAVIDRLPAYTRWTSIIAVAGLVVTILVSLAKNHHLPDPLGLQFAPEVSIGSAVSFGLTLVSNVMIWLFAVWSLSFATFIVVTSHRVARAYPDRPVQGRQFRWLQLYAATLLPIVLFATAWNSTTGPSVVGGAAQLLPVRCRPRAVCGGAVCGRAEDSDKAADAPLDHLPRS